MIIFTLTFRQRSLLNVFIAGSHVYGLYQKYSLHMLVISQCLTTTLKGLTGVQILVISFVLVIVHITKHLFKPHEFKILNVNIC